MIDFHTHILPEMDDGSGSISESIEMLRECWLQGIDTVVLTPHFYRENEDVESFLTRREAAFRELRPIFDNKTDIPCAVLGAEVLFFPGISLCDETSELCIDESRTLLLEMPYEDWTGSIIDEVRKLISVRRFKVIIAHVEKYLPYIHGRNKLYELLDIGAIFQINTSNFKGFIKTQNMLNLLKMSDSFILGTDCHNMDDRKPHFSVAVEAIYKKFGPERMNVIEELEKSLLQGVNA